MAEGPGLGSAGLADIYARKVANLADALNDVGTKAKPTDLCAA